VCREIFLSVPPSLKKHKKACIKVPFSSFSFGLILYLGVVPNFFNQISVPQSQKG